MNLELAANLILMGIVVLVAVSMIRFHKNEQYKGFNLIDLITDHAGKVSRPACMEVGSWLLASWGFIVLINQNRLTEWYMGAYIGAFVLRAAHAAYLAATTKKDGANGPGPGSQQ